MARLGWAVSLTSVLVTLGVAGPLGLTRGSQTEPLAVERLHLVEGQTFVLGAEHGSMVVSEWIMEDDTTVVLTPAICEGGHLDGGCTWRISADSARFGAGTRIVGVGTEATEPGGGGGDGVSVEIRMGLVSLGDLLIDVRGGRGAKGVAGDRGAPGRRASCGSAPFQVRPARGGRRGMRGGTGGDGGKGGSVTIEYWFAGGRIVSDGEFAIENEGGTPGAGGDGGPGGAGGRGTYCVGYLRRLGSAGGGPQGPQGPEGRVGETGALDVKLLTESPEAGIGEWSAAGRGGG